MLQTTRTSRIVAGAAQINAPLASAQRGALSLGLDLSIHFLPDDAQDANWLHKQLWAAGYRTHCVALGDYGREAFADKRARGARCALMIWSRHANISALNADIARLRAQGPVLFLVEADVATPPPALTREMFRLKPDSAAAPEKEMARLLHWLSSRRLPKRLAPDRKNRARRPIWAGPRHFWIWLAPIACLAALWIVRMAFR